MGLRYVYEIGPSVAASDELLHYAVREAKQPLCPESVAACSSCRRQRRQRRQRKKGSAPTKSNLHQTCRGCGLVAHISRTGGQWLSGYSEGGRTAVGSKKVHAAHPTSERRRTGRGGAWQAREAEGDDGASDERWGGRADGLAESEQACKAFSPSRWQD